MPLVPSSLLGGYRLFLAKLSPKGYLDDASRRHRQRPSSKLLIRLRAKALATRASVDPFRAFRRLKAATLKLRHHPRTKLTPLRHVFRRTPTVQQSLINAELQELFGSEGFVRLGFVLALGGMSKLLMHVGNRTVIQGEEHLQMALMREEGRPLITVSNHVGSIDDPLVTAALVPSSFMLQPKNVRWTMCATDRCFSNSTWANFFRAVKVLPVERGAGLHQLGMRAAECRLNQGDWVHIFPEGTRSRTGELLPPRLGVGKLIANCDRMPLVVPFVHSGMNQVMPPGSVIPKTGKQVRVLVGEPIAFDDVIALAEDRGWTDMELYQAITHKIGVSMARLWVELEEKPLPSWAKLRSSDYCGRIVGRDAYSVSKSLDFLRCIKQNMEGRLHRTIQYLPQYLEYCQMRSRIVKEQLFPSPI